MRNRVIKIISSIFTLLFLIGCENNLNNTNSNDKSNRVVDLSVIEKQENSLQSLTIPIEPSAIIHVNGQRGLANTTTHKLLNIDASSSFDPDGDSQKLSYIWTNMNGYLLSNEKTFVTKYDKKSFDEITLRVIDEQKLTSLDRVCILVDMYESEVPLVVRVDGDHKVEAGKTTHLTGRGVCRKDIVKFEWREDGLLLSNQATLKAKFGKGEHVLTLTIEDMEGNQATDNIIIKSI
jgi:hypothetical protein